MPVTQVAVIYSVAQARRRRVVVPTHDDSELLAHTNLAQGEGVWLMPIGLYKTASTPAGAVPALGIDGHLALHLGRAAQSDRCAVVDAAGNVVKVVCACPVCDRIDAHTIIPHPDAVTGDTIINGVHTPSVAA